jgi:hypothetical protein
MRLQDYSVAIPQGTETGNGYVEMAHGSQYNLLLSNHSGRKTDAEVYVDGKSVGVFRLDPYQSWSIERPVNEKKLFTFFNDGSAEFYQSDLGNVSKNDLGLITVIFKPEKRVQPTYKYRGPSGQSINTMYSCSTSEYSSGGTGLTGRSNQEFREVKNLEYSNDEFLSINLRLVSRNRNTVSPLKALTRSTPIPKPV